MADRRAGSSARRVAAGTFAQVAISCVLLVVAMLFARSFGSLTHMDAGFRRQNVLLFGISAEGSGLNAPEHVLGAQRHEVVQSMARGAVLLVGVGTVVGLSASAVLAPLIESLLFGVHSTDWQTFAATAVLLITIGAAAAYWPARRAARVDPMIALRVE